MPRMAVMKFRSGYTNVGAVPCCTTNQYLSETGCKVKNFPSLFHEVEVSKSLDNNITTVQRRQLESGFCLIGMSAYRYHMVQGRHDRYPCTVLYSSALSVPVLSDQIGVRPVPDSKLIGILRTFRFSVMRGLANHIKCTALLCRHWYCTLCSTSSELRQHAVASSLGDTLGQTSL